MRRYVEESQYAETEVGDSLAERRACEAGQATCIVGKLSSGDVPALRGYVSRFAARNQEYVADGLSAKIDLHYGPDYVSYSILSGVFASCLKLGMAGAVPSGKAPKRKNR